MLETKESTRAALDPFPGAGERSPVPAPQGVKQLGDVPWFRHCGLSENWPGDPFAKQAV
jgi:hypothetical protein